MEMFTAAPMGMEGLETEETAGKQHSNVFNHEKSVLNEVIFVDNQVYRFRKYEERVDLSRPAPLQWPRSVRSGVLPLLLPVAFHWYIYILKLFSLWYLTNNGIDFC